MDNQEISSTKVRLDIFIKIEVIEYSVASFYFAKTNKWNRLEISNTPTQPSLNATWRTWHVP